MSDTRPDLETARRMLRRARRQKRAWRWILGVLVVLAAAVAVAYLMLNTVLFEDVYRQLVADLGWV